MLLIEEKSDVAHGCQIHYIGVNAVITFIVSQLHNSLGQKK